MILIYTILVIILALTLWLMNRRVASLERKYAHTALTVDSMARDLTLKGGNSSKPDVCLAAKHQFLLGNLVQKRDRLEDKYARWQVRAEKFSRVVSAVKNWKGKKLPYTFGVLDVSAILYAADQFGVGSYFSINQAVEMIRQYLSF